MRRLPDEPALALALLRVVVPAMVLAAPGFREGPRVAAWDPARFVVPEGLGWLVLHVPISPRVALAAQALTLFSAGCAIVGIHARPALAVMACSAFYLFSIAQLTGFVWHDMHLLWLAALLAASPCSDVLAWDAKLLLEASGTRWAPSLLFARALLAAVYFFPGFHKLLAQGPGWALSDNLRLQLWWKWAEHGSVPAFRIDRVPGLLEAGGIGVLCFELGFPLLIAFRRTRLAAAIAGLAFHGLSQIIFLIPFASLWLCYAALVDPRPAARLVRRVLGMPVDRAAARARDPARAPAPLASRSAGARVSVVGAVLLVGATVQGARGQMQGYPFACYPTFARRPPSLLPDLGIVAVGAVGGAVEIPHARDARGYRTQRQWAEIWSLAGATGPISAERLVAYLRAVAGTEPARSLAGRAARVAFYRDLRSVDPRDRGAPPIERVLLGQVRMGAGEPARGATPAPEPFQLPVRP